ncbi:hypothetical protein [Albibacterium bauzanense]|uniref:Uncharacterized protein n=1 Tax=Albibacterium bauzanense TaxID=653929 RepID=A0A4R1LVC9_9SPHI|nr:hypothetical protein [Albibacterium bauzanense]TCK82812.1 hypothetical protein C8N28_1397 [Albibacterium bauzanense]
MGIIPQSVSEFIDGLRNRLDSSITLKEINSQTFAIEILESDYLLVFYLQGASKIKFEDQESSKLFIHIDEDVWLRKPQLLLNRIKVLVGKGERVYARQCVTARIDKQTALSFQKEHHLQVELPGKYRYGLFFQGELVAIMVFSGGRLMRHSENYRSFECLRFCSKQQLVVIGGFSKLLKAFVHDFKPNDVMTYVDADWSDGSKFEKLGFIKIMVTDPQVFFVNKENNERLLIPKFEDHSLSNTSFYRVANSGSIKMIKYC